MFNKIKRNLIHYAATIIFSGLFLALYLRDGVTFVPDSMGYINKGLSREPGYPLWLSMFKGIFGECYLDVAVIAQILLAIFSSIFFVRFIGKQFHLKWGAIVMLYGVIGIYYNLPSIVFRGWGTASALMIFTEGICYPVFLIYVVFLLSAAFNRAIKPWIVAMVLSTVLYFTRSGAAYLYVLNIIVGMYALKIMQRMMRLGVVVATTGVLLFVATVGERVYFKCVCGEYIGHSTRSVVIMTNFVSLSDEADLNSFDDEAVNEIFDELYHEMKENDLLLSGRKDNLWTRAVQIEKIYDEIIYEVYYPLMEKYYAQNGISDRVEKDKYTDRVATDIYKALFPRHIGQWFKGYVGLNLLGFKRVACAVCPPHWIMNVFCVAVYLLYLLVMVMTHKKKDVLILYVVSTLAIFGCIASTTLVIMPITRYMLYVFVLMYTALIVGMHDIYECVGRRAKCQRKTEL